MDVDGGSENTDLEQNEFGGIEELDADVQAQTGRVPFETEIISAEAHDARIKSSPERPTADEVERRDATHCPYGSWCSVCVAASAKEDPHPRKDKKDTEMGLPVIDFDYDLLEDKLTVLVVQDAESGAKLAYDC